MNECQLEGHYANYFQVGHNAFEFVLDFGQYYPENQEKQKASLHTRIIISPVYARILLETIRGSLESYERAFGRISEVSQ